MTAITIFPCVRRTVPWPAAGYPDTPRTRSAAQSNATHLIIPHLLRCHPDMPSVVRDAVVARRRPAPGLACSNAEIRQQFLLLTGGLLVGQRADGPPVHDEVVPVRHHGREPEVLLDEEHGQ